MMYEIILVSPFSHEMPRIMASYMENSRRAWELVVEFRCSVQPGYRMRVRRMEAN